MKKAIGVLFLTTSALARADQLDLTRPDQQAHFAVSAGLAFASAELARALHAEHPVALGAAVSVLFGIVKEAADQSPSGGDAAANVLGAASGAVLSWSVHF